MRWYWEALHKRYAQFSGRARRREYWYYVLFDALMELALIAGIAIFGAIAPSVSYVFAGLLIAHIVVTVIPGISVSVRRLHDTGKSGWWYLLNFAPLGSIVLLIFYCTDGDRGENGYGPDPKAPPASPAPTAYGSVFTA